MLGAGANGANNHIRAAGAAAFGGRSRLLLCGRRPATFRQVQDWSVHPQLQVQPLASRAGSDGVALQDSLGNGGATRGQDSGKLWHPAAC